MTEGTITFYIAIAGVLIGLGALCLSLYNTYKQHHIRGPEFIFPEVLLESRSGEGFGVKILVQNIGDRAGYLRVENMTIKQNDNIFKLQDYYDPPWLEWISEPYSQTEKDFLFSVPLEENLLGALFIADGIHSTHKGKMVERTWEIPLRGYLVPFIPDEMECEKNG